MYIERIIVKNRQPIGDLDITLEDSSIYVLTSLNGKGKTTLLSYIADAWVEITKTLYRFSYAGHENSYYRILSPIESVDVDEFSFVYIRFRCDKGFVDYINYTQKEKIDELRYNNSLTLSGKIPFSKLTDESGKYLSSFKNEDIKNEFEEKVITYFPSYRYDLPSYINEVFKKQEISFITTPKYNNYLPNPLEVITGIDGIVNWLMNVLLDNILYARTNANSVLWNNVNSIINLIMKSKCQKGHANFAVGRRNINRERISVVETYIDDNKNLTNRRLAPSIYDLSSGEKAILTIFLEIIRQADKNITNIKLEDIRGIVLIDEIDKHLHISMQKEVLPTIMEMFPKIQFITTSHSPFFNIGLGEHLEQRSHVIDFDNDFVFTTPAINEVYQDAYNVFIGERNKFAQELQQIRSHLDGLTHPVVITEGKTDIKHITKAMEALHIPIEFDTLSEEVQPEGCSNLENLIQNLVKSKVVPQSHKVIAIFDCDVDKYVREYPAPYKEVGNNVYAFCIPTPKSRAEKGQNKISIEYLYSDEEIHQELPNGTHLFFGNEFERNSIRRCIADRSLRLATKEGAGEDRIVENTGGQAVYDNDDKNYLAKKNEFAEAIVNDQIKISEESWENFRPIVDVIQQIIKN